MRITSVNSMMMEMYMCGMCMMMRAQNVTRLVLFPFDSIRSFNQARKTMGVFRSCFFFAFCRKEGNRQMIELKNLCKTYPSAAGGVEALRDISLTIEDGEIFGIIGLSGAGKSTLVRCINLLERPTSGSVIIDGQDITQLPRPELLKMRRSISMIFQGFNLLEQRSVLRNVTFPLEIAGVKRGARRRRPWSF